VIVRSPKPIPLRQRSPRLRSGQTKQVDRTPHQITVFTGRFGSGKTEIALNYALYLTECGLAPLLIDLDIVTPYFRTRDKAEEMSRYGVEVVAPFQAGRYIDVPAISPRILGAIEQPARPVVIDLGGDEQGSRALAQYAAAVYRQDHSMNFVVNPYRPFMNTVAGIKTAIQEIEVSSKLKVSALVSNPNLMSESSRDLFAKGHRLTLKASRTLGLQIVFTVMSEFLSEIMDDRALDSPTLIIHRFFPMFDTVQEEAYYMSRIVIDKDRCKGCGLCTLVCPHDLVRISDRFNAKGYRPAELVDPDDVCIGCANCATMCPDVAIVVYRTRVRQRTS